jgi:hypothetical protein
VGAAADTPITTVTPKGSVAASSILTTTLAAHPYKQL